MTIYCASAPGLPAPLRGWRASSALLAAACLTACDVQWGGASVELQNPVPPPAEVEAEPAGGDTASAPLPEGPLLWAVRTDGPEGSLAVPVARFSEEGPVPLEYPSPVPDAYRARFDSAFAVPGRELAIAARGGRVGSLVLSGPPRVPDAGCPSVVPGRPLVPPGAAVPSLVFAVRSADVVGDIEVPEAVEPDTRIRTFGPILAEQLLRQGGEARPYLAQRADLVAVPWPGDQRPAMAATYVINDSLGAPPPQGDAVSLFFLARFDPTAGYVVRWSEMRRYGAGEREVYTWLEALPGRAGRIDVVTLHDGRARRLATSLERGDRPRAIDWTEGSRCRALELLGVP